MLGLVDGVEPLCPGVDGTAAARIGPGVPEVVEVAVGDGHQALVRIAEHPVGALAELRVAEPERVACRASLGPQSDVFLGIAAGERLGRRAAAVTDATGVAELGDQLEDLRPRQAAHLAQIAFEQAPVGRPRWAWAKRSPIHS